MSFERNTRPQDVTWFLDQLETEKLDLSPSFQRKSVWNSKDRQFFTETILLNFPCPAVFLYKDIDRNGKAIYRVIDGKQRLQTIVMFRNNEFKTSDNSSLPIEARNKLFNELSDDFKKAFWNFNIPVEMINTDEATTLNNIFDRLNRNNKKLNNQELRNARYDGFFFSFVEKESEDPFWEGMKLFTKGNISRMEDQQFIAELASIIIEEKIIGFDHDKLDEYYAKYDSEFDIEPQVREAFLNVKRLLTEVNNVDNVIYKKYRTRGLFYSLWAYFSLIGEGPGATPEFISAKLNEIMVNYKEPERETDTDIATFLINSKGAMTDKTPREKRHASLVTLLTP